jgi:hypothetical protein
MTKKQTTNPGDTVTIHGGYFNRVDVGEELTLSDSHDHFAYGDNYRYRNLTKGVTMVRDWKIKHMGRWIVTKVDEKTGTITCGYEIEPKEPEFNEHGEVAP